MDDRGLPHKVCECGRLDLSFGFALNHLGFALYILYSTDHERATESFDSTMAYEQSANSRPPKQEKREVDYSLGNPERHCGRLTDTDSDFCRHFIPHREERPDVPAFARW
jgi:hypothetical protein